MMTKLWFILILVTCVSFASAAPREFSLDLWDWTAPCRDLPTFKKWAADMKSIGCTRIEISAPWNLLEPKPGQYDFSFVADRLAVARSLGMGLRIRINSYYGGATPSWYVGDFWRDIHGKPPTGTPVPCSITDARFWNRYGPMCSALAAKFKGEDIFYNAFIGVHGELKWADWWSYDPSTLALWHRAVVDRPQWLADVAGNANLPATPPIPPMTHGRPDNSAASKAWIAFREKVWRDAVTRFDAAIHTGDPNAKISAPLGESYRRGSAQMSNLDYFGLSRGADQIVHSYDFYWHPDDGAWEAAASVAAFRGISGIHDIVFEFDGPALVEKLGYDVPQQLRIADAALSQGAGLKAANYSYDPRLPSSWPVLVDFAKHIASTQPTTLATPSQTVLLFVSKWANYCYREKTEWLHEAQFGAWKMLTDHRIAVRFICEDNLDENLSAYRGLYVAFSPPELLPPASLAKLNALEAKLPSIVELSLAPSHAPTTRQSTFTPQTNGKTTLLNYPLAYEWIGANHAQAEAVVTKLIEKVWP